VSLRSGVAIRSQGTAVFDVHNGLITRLAIHYDLSPVPASGPERRIRPHAPTAGSPRSRCMPACCLKSGQPSPDHEPMQLTNGDLPGSAAATAWSLE
jgi:hypothetical protein